MQAKRIHSGEVWSQLDLCAADQERISDFLQAEFGIRRTYVVRRMHITVYHARRPMPGVSDLLEPARVRLPAEQTRFMVMAPGGENPREHLDPAARKVGIRVHRQSVAMPTIQAYRSRLLQHEGSRVLGFRQRSDNRRNAFGAEHFQPHMTILRAGSGISRDLRIIGERFRSVLGELLFDRFAIRCSTSTDKSATTNAA